MFAPDTAQAGSEAVEGISKEKLNLNKKTTSGNFALVYFGCCSSSSTLFLGSCFFFSSHAVSKQVSLPVVGSSRYIRTNIIAAAGGAKS